MPTQLAGCCQHDLVKPQEVVLIEEKENLIEKQNKNIILKLSFNKKFENMINQINFWILSKNIHAKIKIK